LFVWLLLFYLFINNWLVSMPMLLLTLYPITINVEWLPNITIKEQLHKCIQNMNTLLSLIIPWFDKVN